MADEVGDVDLDYAGSQDWKRRREHEGSLRPQEPSPRYEPTWAEYLEANRYRLPGLWVDEEDHSRMFDEIWKEWYATRQEVRPKRSVGEVLYIVFVVIPIMLMFICIVLWIIAP